MPKKKNKNLIIIIGIILLFIIITHQKEKVARGGLLAMGGDEFQNLLTYNPVSLSRENLLQRNTLEGCENTVEWSKNHNYKCVTGCKEITEGLYDCVDKISGYRTDQKFKLGYYTFFRDIEEGCGADSDAADRAMYNCITKNKAPDCTDECTPNSWKCEGKDSYFCKRGSDSCFDWIKWETCNIDCNIEVGSCSIGPAPETYYCGKSGSIEVTDSIGKGCSHICENGMWTRYWHRESDGEIFKGNVIVDGTSLCDIYKEAEPTIEKFAGKPDFKLKIISSPVKVDGGKTFSVDINIKNDGEAGTMKVETGLYYKKTLDEWYTTGRLATTENIENCEPHETNVNTKEIYLDASESSIVTFNIKAPDKCFVGDWSKEYQLHTVSFINCYNTGLAVGSTDSDIKDIEIGSNKKLCVGEEATCSDGLKNQDETSTDCGGTKCNPCRNNYPCERNSDCSSGCCDINTKKCSEYNICQKKERYIKILNNDGSDNSYSKPQEIKHGDIITLPLQSQGYISCSCTSQDAYNVDCSLNSLYINMEEMPGNTIYTGTCSFKHLDGEDKVNFYLKGIETIKKEIIECNDGTYKCDRSGEISYCREGKWGHLTINCEGFGLEPKCKDSKIEVIGNSYGDICEGLCADSDAGKNYEIFGSVYLSEQMKFGEQKKSDTCDGGDIGGNQIEYYCTENDQIGIDQRSCEEKIGPGYACEYGRCITQKKSCADPDKKDIYKSTTTIVSTSMDNKEMYTDSCTLAGQVKEWYCDWSDPKSELFDCPVSYKCEDGKCIKTTEDSPKCGNDICDNNENMVSCRQDCKLDNNALIKKLRKETRPLVNGLEIDVGGHCTLGMIILYNNKNYILTAGHCITREQSNIPLKEDFNREIKQGSEKIGVPYKADMNGRIDAALVSINEGIASLLYVDHLGNKIDGWGSVYEGMRVYKIGRTTGLTFGTVIDIYESCNYAGSCRKGFTVRGENNLPFSQSGDSGSAIITIEEPHKIVGLVWGGSSLTKNKIEIDTTYSNMPYDIQNVMEIN